MLISIVLPPSRVRRHTPTRTLPRSVNRIALFSRSSTIWLSARRSTRSKRSSSFVSTTSESPLRRATSRRELAAASTSPWHCVGWGLSSLIPATLVMASSLDSERAAAYRRTTTDRPVGLVERRQALPDGELDQRRQVVDAELAHDAAAVGFHGARRQAERGGHFGVAPARRHRLDDLALGRRQPVERLALVDTRHADGRFRSLPLRGLSIRLGRGGLLEPGCANQVPKITKCVVVSGYCVLLRLARRQSVLNGELNQLGEIRNLELVHDAAAVALDGARREVQHFRDVGAGVAVGDQGEDGALARV